MRVLPIAVLVFGTSLILNGQGVVSPMSNPVRPMPAPINALPYGNIIFPGGFPSHPTALGGTVSGNIPYTGVPAGGRYPHGGGRNQTVVVPYAVPVYGGGHGGYY